MTEEDVETVRGILARSEVLSWNSWYGRQEVQDPDTMDGGGSNGWVLYIQYDDNTISRFGGDGTEYPSGYDTFVEEMIAFTHSKKDA